MNGMVVLRFWDLGIDGLSSFTTGNLSIYLYAGLICYASYESRVVLPSTEVERRGWRSNCLSNVGALGLSTRTSDVINGS